MITHSAWTDRPSAAFWAGEALLGALVFSRLGRHCGSPSGIKNFLGCADLSCSLRMTRRRRTG
jgi:hypothetical protein